MQKLLEEFAALSGEPSDSEINTLASQWQEYISKSDPVRALTCKKDFIMGMVMMGKRMKK